MKTTRPLIELVPNIVSTWNNDRKNRELDWHLYEILNNSLLKHVRDSLRDEMISSRSYHQTIKRIPSINIHKRVVDKTSKVYIRPPVRTTNKQSDKDLMEAIADNMELDKVMMASNRFLNSTFRFSIEPYIDDSGTHRCRVLPAHQFMPYADNILYPNTMTVYVKYITTETDKDGQDHDVLSLVSDTEFLIIDTAKRIRTDIMSSMGFSAENRFGIIPAIYGKTTEDMLVPFRNEEGMDMAILIPKLFADINFASKYLSHSIMWGKNINMAKIDVNADAFMDLGDSANGSDPEIGVITPSVDIPNQLSSISSQVQSYFESIGIKTSVDTGGSNPVSAVSKAIDDADVSDIRLEQIGIYKGIEKDFWRLVSILQEDWVRTNKSTIKKTFTPGFVNSFRISYPETKALQSVSQRLDEGEKWMNLKLSSRRQILRELKPELTEEQITAQLAEADKEILESVELRLAGLPGLRPEKRPDGTFQEGNEAGANARPENNIRGRSDG